MNYTISDKSLVILLNLAKAAGETQAYKEIISEMARRIKNELLRVWNVGQERPDAEWLCSHYDTWVRNPHYRGLPGRHPEDDSDED
jgi:hypothetical protein